LWCDGVIKLKAADQLTQFCHQSHAYQQDAGANVQTTDAVDFRSADVQFSLCKRLTSIQHIQKVIAEIISTEKQYIKVNCAVIDKVTN
jgi:hypothetical protein